MRFCKLLMALILIGSISVSVDAYAKPKLKSTKSSTKSSASSKSNKTCKADREKAALEKAKNDPDYLKMVESNKEGLDGIGYGRDMKQWADYLNGKPGPRDPGSLDTNDFGAAINP